MRFIVIALILAAAGPATAFDAVAPEAASAPDNAFARFAGSLPDPAAVGLIFAGLGLVVGAQRGRSRSRAD